MAGGGIAVALGVATAAPAQVAGPEWNTPAVASADEETARRWVEEARQLYEQGKYPEALSLLQRALPIVEKALGPDHPNVATALNNLAELYRTKGDYARRAPVPARPFHP